MAQKIYFMSLDFYRKRWPINTKHRWKIWLVTRARKNLMEPLPISYSNLQWRGYIYSMCVLLLGMCVLLLGWMGCRNPGPIFVGEACRRVRLVGQSIGIDHTTGTMWLATTCHFSILSAFLLHRRRAPWPHHSGLRATRPFFRRCGCISTKCRNSLYQAEILVVYG